MKTKIYGASDDLIEIEGAISDEIGCYKTCEKGILFSCSDGTRGIITYNGDWQILVNQEGSLFEKVVPNNDEIDHTDIDAKGCTSYSDVLVLKDGVEWVEIGKKTFTK
jgi:thiamine phosphate synthase YjbQ (UPF0047 family)